MPQRATVPVFDYDRTLCSDTITPCDESIIMLVQALRSKLGIPLLILTAGSVNSLRDEDNSDNWVDRPLELGKRCNLRVVVNDFNINADICVYGQYMCDPKTSDPELTKGKYIRGSVTSYRPVTMINGNTYHILNSSGEKKLSVLYHILLSHGIDAELLFVDDMHHHDMSGLDGIIVDPFECTQSTYYLINPLMNNVDSRLYKIAASLDNDKLKETLEHMSRSVWRRYLY
jgi:hypothetical protein